MKNWPIPQYRKPQCPPPAGSSESSSILILYATLWIKHVLRRLQQTPTNHTIYGNSLNSSGWVYQDASLLAAWWWKRCWEVVLQLAQGFRVRYSCNVGQTINLVHCNWSRMNTWYSFLAKHRLSIGNVATISLPGDWLDVQWVMVSWSLLQTA